MDSTLLAALVPLLLASLALVVVALVDLSRSEVRWLPRWAWALFIVASVPMGAVVYLLGGRVGRVDPDRRVDAP
ncbi:MAG TPA: PLDc N-terminal domain-containing protein [Acidimicrobiales bacterium]|nr:PLDc N-terminal domain-containing protein [Acidimicrobiales bacterium]